MIRKNIWKKKYIWLVLLDSKICYEFLIIMIIEFWRRYDIKYKLNVCYFLNRYICEILVCEKDGK